MITETARSADTVLDAVRSVRGLVEDHALDAEQQRTLPRRVVEAMAEAGLFALTAPAAVGGREVDPVVAMAAVEEMTSYDTSAGWAMAIANGGAGVVGARLPDDGVRDVFGCTELTVPILAGTFAPTGAAVPTATGYRVTGRWSIASGIRHADWVTGTCVVLSDDSAETITAVVSKAAVDVIDTWHVAGLQGTGSDDWAVHELDVPSTHVIRPLGLPLRGGDVFALPLFSYIGFAHTGFALGCARRSLHEVTVAAGTKTRLLATSTLAMRSAFQRDLGRADAALRAARLFAVDVIGAALEAVHRGDTVTPSMDADVRVAATHATDVAIDICTMAFRYLGAAAIHNDAPVQRYFRDVHAAGQHAFVADTSYETLAQARLGF